MRHMKGSRNVSTDALPRNIENLPAADDEVRMNG